MFHIEDDDGLHLHNYSGRAHPRETELHVFVAHFTELNIFISRGFFTCLMHLGERQGKSFRSLPSETSDYFHNFVK